MVIFIYLGQLLPKVADITHVSANACPEAFSQKKSSDETSANILLEAQLQAQKRVQTFTQLCTFFIETIVKSPIFS